MLLDPWLDNEEHLVCTAILVYGAYMATNHFRLKGGTDSATAKCSIEQFCRRGVEGHTSSQRIVDTGWNLGVKRRRVDQH